MQNATSQISFMLTGSQSQYVGSGFYYYDTVADLPHGYFVTAAHCVMQITNSVYVKISKAYIQNPITDKWFSVNIADIRIDGVADIALIKTGINFTDYPQYCLKLNTEPVHPGDPCFVVGNPAGIDEDSISSGCVRDPHYCESNGMQITDSVLVNAPGIGGNSGGPIVNVNGDVIGIYTFGRTNTECFGGGSNQSVLSATLPILKTGDNKQKLYLGLDWYILSAINLNAYYPNQTEFATSGVVVDRVNESSPFYAVIQPTHLLLKCEINGTTIEFGNKNNQRTPGVLLYYPVNTQVTIYYKILNDAQVYQQVVTLNKTYANVSNELDGPLQTGFREKIDSTTITNVMTAIN
jgi:S1-C subfamily serine protease